MSFKIDRKDRKDGEVGEQAMAAQLYIEGSGEDHTQDVMFLT